MTAAEFWDSTLAQMCALIPQDAPGASSAPKGTADDLIALAAM